MGTDAEKMNGCEIKISEENNNNSEEEDLEMECYQDEEEDMETGDDYGDEKEENRSTILYCYIPSLLEKADENKKR